MADQLYRVQFKPETVMVYADDPTDAIHKARNEIGAIVRPASTDEMLAWMSIELTKMIGEVDRIEKHFKGDDCE